MLTITSDRFLAVGADKIGNLSLTVESMTYD